MGKRGPDRTAPRVALIHYWLVNWRGGEKVFAEIARLFPQADIFTLVLDRRCLPADLRERRIITSRLQRLPFARRFYKKLLPWMPGALEALDLSGYDLVISSESGPAKGILPQAGARHLCYVHSPMRYLWNMREEYLSLLPVLLRPFARRAMHRLRIWDFQNAQRVDTFLCNSKNVVRRVRNYWQRESTVLYPPVELERFSPSGSPDRGYYLCLGELERYKRIDLAVTACTELGLPLVVAGRGGEEKRLRRLAGPTVSFVGRVDDAEAVRLYQGCRALLFPGEEDFGLTPLEAQACGRPVVAYGAGGALETVLDGRTGIFFDEQSPASLAAALQRLENGVPGLRTAACVRNAARFAPERFRRGLMAAVGRLLGTAQVARIAGGPSAGRRARPGGSRN